MEAWWHSKEWDLSKANSKLCSSMFRVEGLSSLCPSHFAACRVHLSLLYGSVPVPSSPWQMSHSSGTSNILGYPMQLRLHWMASRSLQAETPVLHTWPQKLSYCRRAHNSFVCIVHDSKVSMTLLSLASNSQRTQDPQVTFPVVFLFLSRKFVRPFPFTSYTLSWVGVLPWWCLSHCRSGPSLMVQILTITDSLEAQALAVTLSLPVSLFFLTCNFVFLSPLFFCHCRPA